MKRRTEKIIYIMILLLAMFISGTLYFQEDVKRWIFSPTDSDLSQGVSNSEKSASVASNLSIPWEIVFLPNQDMLITERPGSLIRVGINKQKYKIDGVEHVGEGGLLGVTLHPEFSKNGYVYLYVTAKGDEGLVNRVERYVYKNDVLSQRSVIIDAIPGAANHDGGRIAFGPDGRLYITTGDAGDEKLAQDTGSLAGKILRVEDDGTIPEDNPFFNEVYSYGHRNSQGIAWDNIGRLWSTEHGRSGIKSGFDELNLIEKGANYGWPLVQGDETMQGMTLPINHSGPDETWAPAGLAFYEGSLYFAGLRGEALYRAKIITGNNKPNVKLTINLREVYGRLRAVSIGPDNMIYLSTSNTDGRGEPKENDDQVLRVDPKIFGR